MKILTQLKTFYNKHPKFYTAILFLILLALSFQLGTCNREKPVTTNSDTQAMKKLQIKSDSLLNANIALNISHQLMIDSFNVKLSDISNATSQWHNSTSEIKKLSIDSAIIKLRQFLNDKDSIYKIETPEMGIRICIGQAGLTEINLTFNDKIYYYKVSKIQAKQILHLIAADSISQLEIKNLELSGSSKDSINKYLALDTLNKSIALKKEIKRANRNKFFRKCFEVTTLVAVLWAAFK